MAALFLSLKDLFWKWNQYNLFFSDTYGQADVVKNITNDLTTSATSLLLSALVDNSDNNNATNVTADPRVDDLSSTAASSAVTAAVTTTSLPYPTTCINGTSYKLGIEPTDFSAIPTKEIIIVILMLLLWVYSIILTRKAWYRLLKE